MVWIKEDSVRIFLFCWYQRILVKNGELEYKCDTDYLYNYDRRKQKLNVDEFRC